ncbi:hypothetical protein HB780_15650 [Rhizobium lusitanum]|uniref:hypothetical protein n=1 Tax=Rhizobium lusitanum TaxID=293958 RepID=UPI00160B5959|nr:hypothetical protein [Rhizobium lusitanum]QND47156.1 hypothetical protein HB780_15650 [Rhizobium lusitanum]
MQRDYPEGFDTIWIGVDRSDVVGAFITAGVGPMPKFCLTASIDVADIEELLLGLPDIGDCEMLVDFPRPDSHVALARKGLLVFDWEQFDKAYVLAAMAKIPLQSSNLPSELQEYALNAFNAPWSFMEQRSIFVADIAQTTDVVG